MSSSDSDSDTPQLSAHALAALQEFYAESSNVATEVSKAVTVQENWVNIMNWVFSN